MYQVNQRIDFCSTCKQFTGVHLIGGKPICYTCRGKKPEYKVIQTIDEPYKPVMSRKIATLTATKKAPRNVLDSHQIIEYIVKNPKSTAHKLAVTFGVSPGHMRHFIETNEVTNKKLKRVSMGYSKGYYYTHVNHMTGEEKVNAMLSENHPMSYTTEEISSFVDLNKDYVSKLCRKLSKDAIVIIQKNAKGNRTLPHRYLANIRTNY
jgi:hypothetical protein